MSDGAPTPTQLVTELKVSAHLMKLEAGVYCVSHAPGAAAPDPSTGLPGARVSVPPGSMGRNVTISGFNGDGWLGALDSAALIHISEGPAQVLMTVYQQRDSQRDPPRLQVTRLGGAAAPAELAVPAAPPPPPAPPASAPVPADAEISAHIQQRGDVPAKLGEWVGVRGSQRWIEGFSLTPKQLGIAPEDVEYQAVLGRGWLSPWGEGGQYCGSRGMALPILGLRVRLRGEAAASHALQVSATFTDGTAVGPVGPGEACEAESLAPLEAFCVTITPAKQEAKAAAVVGDAPGRAEKPVAKRAKAAPAKPAPAPVKPEPVKAGPAKAKAAPAKPAPVKAAPAKAAAKVPAKVAAKPVPAARPARAAPAPVAAARGKAKPAAKRGR